VSADEATHTKPHITSFTVDLINTRDTKGTSTMTQHLEKNSGTLLPIALSCLFFLFMAASAITSLPADAVTPDQAVASSTIPEAPVTAEVSDPALADPARMDEMEDAAALPVAMLMEPTPSEHQVSYTGPSRGLERA
jgi:hypothetical protein